MNLALLSQLASQAFGLDLEVLSVQPTSFMVKVALAEGLIVYYPASNQYDAALPKERRYKTARYKDRALGHQAGELAGSKAAARLATLLHDIWADRLPQIVASDDLRGYRSSWQSIYQ